MTYVPERVRQMLRFAFSETAALDTEMFVSILDREGLRLSPRELRELVEEMSREEVARSRATFRRVNRITRYVEDPAKRARLSRHLTNFFTTLDTIPN